MSSDVERTKRYRSGSERPGRQLSHTRPGGSRMSDPPKPLPIVRLPERAACNRYAGGISGGLAAGHNYNSDRLRHFIHDFAEPRV